MPAADSANIRPTKSSSARSALAAILRIDRFSVAPFSSRCSSSELSHSVTISTRMALKAPSIRLRTLTVAPPSFQVIWSSSSSSSGSTPVTHSTTAIHATHENVRSNMRTSWLVGKAWCSTRTVSRMAASDIRMGTTTLNTAVGTTPCSSQRASSASISAASGNITPSTMRWPNQTEFSRGASAPRSRRTTPQASSRQPTKAASSISADGLVRLATRRDSSSAVGADATAGPAI